MSTDLSDRWHDRVTKQGHAVQRKRRAGGKGWHYRELPPARSDVERLLRSTDLADETARFILADAMLDANRQSEADLLRSYRGGAVIIHEGIARLPHQVPCDVMMGAIFAELDRYPRWTRFQHCELSRREKQRWRSWLALWPHASLPERTPAGAVDVHFSLPRMQHRGDVPAEMLLRELRRDRFRGLPPVPWELRNLVMSLPIALHWMHENLATEVDRGTNVLGRQITIFQVTGDDLKPGYYHVEQFTNQHGTKETLIQRWHTLSATLEDARQAAALPAPPKWSDYDTTS